MTEWLTRSLHFHHWWHTWKPSFIHGRNKDSFQGSQSQNSHPAQLFRYRSSHHYFQFSSVQVSHSVVSDSLWSHGLQHTRPPSLSPTPWVYSNSGSSSQWCHLTISSSVIPFSSHLQSLLASGSFPMSQFFTPGGQSIGVSASASVLPKNIQDWFFLGWTAWIFRQSKRLSRVFSNTTVQKYQLFSTQVYTPTLISIHDYWKKHSFD